MHFVITAAGIVVIVVATLWPFTFSFDRLTWVEFSARFGISPETFLDLPRNILLFIPFGFGVASWMNARGSSPRATVVLTLLAGVLVTICVESLQVFLPGRTPNVSDVVGNTGGVVVSIVCFRSWQRRCGSAHVFGVGMQPPSYGRVLTAYLVVAVLLSCALMRSMRPGSWGSASRVDFGTELTGQTPWEGKVRNLVILDRAVDDSHAAQLLNGNPPDLALGQDESRLTVPWR